MVTESVFSLVWIEVILGVPSENKKEKIKWNLNERSRERERENMPSFQKSQVKFNLKKVCQGQSLSIVQLKRVCD